MSNFKVISDKKLQDIENITNRLLLYCNKGEIIYTKSTVDNEREFKKSDVADQFLNLFESSQSSIAKGLNINDHSFAIHRFFDDMIVGRRGDETNGEGFTVIKTKCNDNDTIYMLTTYQLPILSSRVTPLMKEYCEQYKAIN